MAELADSFDALADQDMWVEAVSVLAGLVFPAFARAFIDNTVDLPDEVYGVGTVLGAEYAAPGDYKRPIQVGAGVNAVIAFGNRFDAVSRFIPENPEVSN